MELIDVTDGPGARNVYPYMDPQPRKDGLGFVVTPTGQYFPVRLGCQHWVVDKHRGTCRHGCRD